MGHTSRFIPTYLQRSVPPKEPCPLKSGRPTVLSSQEPSPSAISSLSWTSERKVTQQALPNFALPVVLVLVVLVLLVTSAVILLLAQRCHRQAKVVLHPYPGLVCGDTNIHTLFPAHSSSSGSREASEAGGPSKEVALVPLVGRGWSGTGRGGRGWTGRLPFLSITPPLLSQNCRSWHHNPCLACWRSLVLLDPEPGPGGGDGLWHHETPGGEVQAACCLVHLCLLTAAQSLATAGLG